MEIPGLQRSKKPRNRYTDVAKLLQIQKIKCTGRIVVFGTPLGQRHMFYDKEKVGIRVQIYRRREYSMVLNSLYSDVGNKINVGYRSAYVACNV